MINLNKITSRDCYPPPIPPSKSSSKEEWLKTLVVFQFRSSSYYIWSLAENKVIAQKCFHITLKGKIEELESEGWIIKLCK